MRRSYRNNSLKFLFDVAFAYEDRWKSAIHSTIVSLRSIFPIHLHVQSLEANLRKDLKVLKGAFARTDSRESLRNPARFLNVSRGGDLSRTKGVTATHSQLRGDKEKWSRLLPLYPRDCKPPSKRVAFIGAIKGYTTSGPARKGVSALTPEEKHRESFAH